MSANDWISLLSSTWPLVGGLFWLIIGSKFVSKDDYKIRVEASDLHREQTNLAMAELKGKVEFLEREASGNFARISQTLIEIKDSLAPFIADHQVLKDRVTRIEVRADVRNC